MRIHSRYFSFSFIAVVLLISVWVVWQYYNPPGASLSFLTDEPWTKDIKFSVTDRFQYMFYSVTGRYAEFAWAVRTSYAIVLTCCIAIFILSVIMAYDVFQRKRKTKRYNELQKQYGQVLRNLAQNKHRMSTAETAEILQKALSMSWDYAYKLLWIDLFIEVCIESDVRNEGLANLQQAMQLLGLVNFMETRLIHGKDSDKLRIIQAVRLLEMA